MVLGLKPIGKPTTLKKIKVVGQNQGIAWSSDSNLWGTNYLNEKTEFWTEPRYCMVVGLKPMGKLTTWKIGRAHV